MKRITYIYLLMVAFLLLVGLVQPHRALAQNLSSWLIGPTSAGLERSMYRPAYQDITDHNDPLLSDSWALELVGASCAWQHTLGSPDVVVAVVDSGVDMNHPDLVDRLLPNGRDFIDGDDDPSDENGHGTNVAGIIASVLDNSEGTAGLAPNVMILPIRVLNEKGYGSDRAIARGVRYAADQGAHVINMSLGATLTISADTESEQVMAAIEYAQSKGSLVVVAAGNDFVPLPNAIVGTNPDALIVAATDRRDRKADFSNSGEWISVAAPGVNIMSAMPTYEVYLTSNQLPREERYKNNYDYMSGTSQATPMVSALAALLFSAHPDWDATQVAATIKNTAADISRQNRRLVEKGMLGTGRIDACAALGGPLAPEEPSAVPEAPDAPSSPGIDDEPSAVPEAPGSPSSPDISDEPSAPPIRVTRPNLMVPIAMGLCGLVLIVTAITIVARAGRRSRTAPAQPMAPVAPRPVAAATPVPPPAVAQQPLPPGAWGALMVLEGPGGVRRYPLSGTEIAIGREIDCAVQIVGDPTVSRHHALIRNTGQDVVVMDTGSTHGTYINGQRIVGPVAVRRGTLMQVGQTKLQFQ